MLEVLLCAWCVALVVLCPFTKVEESFNLQALHDIIFHGDLAKYDHHEFPGVVPRSFLGPIFVAVPSYPLVLVSQHFGTKLTAQYVVRSVLGLMVSCALIAFGRAVSQRFGSQTCSFVYLVTLCQFHFLFYASRTLPNTFALVLVLLAFRFWLLQKHGLFIWTAGAAIIIFRGELAILFGIILVMGFASRSLTVGRTLVHCLPAGLLFLVLTIIVDSVFWRRWLWPEGEVVFFNTILNKSAIWGTSPIWWYFLSALPRVLSFPLLLFPWGLYRDKRTHILAFPALGYIVLYSFLPHKELRFIIYIVPFLNTVIGAAYADLWKNRRKYFRLVPVGVVCSLMATMTLSLGFLAISMHNYPGGNAFWTFHQLAKESSDGPVSVHIGVDAAMTGVSRFGEIEPTWNYSKLEGEPPGSPKLTNFQYLLITASDYPHYSHTHQLLHKEQGFAGIQFKLREFPPIRMLLEDKIYVIKKKDRENADLFDQQT